MTDKLLTTIDQDKDQNHEREEIYTFFSKPENRKHFEELLRFPENKQKLRYFLEKGFRELIENAFEEKQSLSGTLPHDSTLISIIHQYIFLVSEEENITFSRNDIETWLRTTLEFKSEQPHLYEIIKTQPLLKQITSTLLFNKEYDQISAIYVAQFYNTLNSDKTLSKNYEQLYKTLVPFDTALRSGRLLIDTIKFGVGSKNKTKTHADTIFSSLYLAFHQEAKLTNTLETIHHYETLSEKQQTHNSKAKEFQKRVVSSPKSANLGKMTEVLVQDAISLYEIKKEQQRLEQQERYHSIGVLLGVRKIVLEKFGKQSQQYENIVLQIASFMDIKEIRNIPTIPSLDTTNEAAKEIENDITALRNRLQTFITAKKFNQNSIAPKPFILEQHPHELELYFTILQTCLKGENELIQTFPSLQEQYTPHLTILPYLSHLQGDKNTAPALKVQPLDEDQKLSLFLFAQSQKQKTKSNEEISEINTALTSTVALTLPNGKTMIVTLEDMEPQDLTERQNECKKDNKILVYYPSFSLDTTSASSLSFPVVSPNSFRTLSKKENTTYSLEAYKPVNKKIRGKTPDPIILSNQSLHDAAILEQSFETRLHKNPLLQQAQNVSETFQLYVHPLSLNLTLALQQHKLSPELVHSSRHAALSLKTALEGIAPHLQNLAALFKNKKELLAFQTLIGYQSTYCLKQIETLLDLCYYNDSEIGKPPLLHMLDIITNPARFNENTVDQRLQHNALKVIGGVIGAVGAIVFIKLTLGLGTPLVVALAGSAGGMVGARVGQLVNESIQSTVYSVGGSGGATLHYDDPTDIELLFSNTTSEEEKRGLLVGMTFEFFSGAAQTYGFGRLGGLLGNTIMSLNNSPLKQFLIKITRLNKVLPSIPLQTEQTLRQSMISVFKRELGDELWEEIKGISLEKITENTRFSFLGDLANIYFSIHAGNNTISIKSYLPQQKRMEIQYDANDSNFLQSTQAEYTSKGYDVTTVDHDLICTYQESGKTYMIHYTPSYEPYSIRQSLEIQSKMNEYNIHYDTEKKIYTCPNGITIDQRTDMYQTLEDTGLLVDTNQADMNMGVIDPEGEKSEYRYAEVHDGKNKIIITAKKNEETDQNNLLEENQEKNQFTPTATLLTQRVDTNTELQGNKVSIAGLSDGTTGSLHFMVNPQNKTITLTSRALTVSPGTLSHIWLHGTTCTPVEFYYMLMIARIYQNPEFSGYTLQGGPLPLQNIDSLLSEFNISYRSTVVENPISASPEETMTITQTTVQDALTLPTKIAALKQNSTYPPEYDFIFTPIVSSDGNTDIPILSAAGINIMDTSASGILLKKNDDPLNPHLSMTIFQSDGAQKTINLTRALLEKNMGKTRLEQEIPPGQRLEYLLSISGIDVFNIQLLQNISLITIEKNKRSGLKEYYSITLLGNGGSFSVRTDYYQSTSGEKTITLSSVTIDPSARSYITATKLIRTMVHRGEKNNISYIDLNAARSGGKQNGYYTRARMGFCETFAVEERAMLVRHLEECYQNSVLGLPESLVQGLKNIVFHEKSSRFTRTSSIIQSILSLPHGKEFRYYYGTAFDGKLDLQDKSSESYQARSEYDKEQQQKEKKGEANGTIADRLFQPQLIKDTNQFAYEQRGKAYIRYERMNKIFGYMKDDLKDIGLNSNEYFVGATDSDGRGENRYAASNIELIFYCKRPLSDSEKTQINYAIQTAFGEFSTSSAHPGTIFIEFKDGIEKQITTDEEGQADENGNKPFYPTRFLDLHLISEGNDSPSTVNQNGLYEAAAIQSYNELKDNGTDKFSRANRSGKYKEAVDISKTGKTGSTEHFVPRTTPGTSSVINYKYKDGGKEQAGIKYGPLRMVQLAMMRTVGYMVEKGLPYETYKKLLHADMLQRCDILLSIVDSIDRTTPSAQKNAGFNERIKTMRETLPKLKQHYAYFLQIHLHMQAAFHQERQTNPDVTDIERKPEEMGSTNEEFLKNLSLIRTTIASMGQVFNNQFRSYENILI